MKNHFILSQFKIVKSVYNLKKPFFVHISSFMMKIFSSLYFTTFVLFFVAAAGLSSSSSSRFWISSHQLPPDFDKTVNTRDFQRQTPFHRQSRPSFTTRDYN